MTVDGWVCACLLWWIMLLLLEALPGRRLTFISPFFVTYMRESGELKSFSATSTLTGSRSGPWPVNSMSRKRSFFGMFHVLDTRRCWSWTYFLVDAEELWAVAEEEDAGARCSGSPVVPVLLATASASVSAFVDACLTLPTWPARAAGVAEAGVAAVAALLMVFLANIVGMRVGMWVLAVGTCLRCKDGTRKKREEQGEEEAAQARINTGPASRLLHAIAAHRLSPHCCGNIGLFPSLPQRQTGTHTDTHRRLAG